MPLLIGTPPPDVPILGDVQLYVRQTGVEYLSVSTWRLHNSTSTPVRP